MNAPVKHPSLESLHAQRKELLKQRAEVQAKWEKLAAADRAAEAAAQALVQFGNVGQAAIENWCAGGCRGAQPGGDFEKYKALLDTNMEAQQVAQMARGAKSNLEARGREIAGELSHNYRALEDAAAIKMAYAVDEEGKEADRLRAELKRREAKIMAARDYFAGRAEDHYKAERIARPAFTACRDAAAGALGDRKDELALSNVERGLVDEVEAEFDGLVKGKVKWHRV